MRKELDLDELKQIKVNIKCENGFTKYVRDNKKIIEHETRSRISLGKGKGFKKRWDIEGNAIVIYIR